MGQLLRRVFNSIAGEATPKRLILLGLDNAGKTTILYNMQLGEVISTVPTIGFNVQTIQYKSLKFQAWDIGGQTAFRNLWHHYYTNTDAVIFVLDSRDQERLPLARETLAQVLEHHDLQGKPLLVLANKSDIAKISLPELVEKTGLQSLRNREWHVQQCCGLNGQGVGEGFEWLTKALKNAK